jgi:5-formyltetrahydrofolate cyclo-ligase
VGFSELVVIGLLVLLFFGSKELPRMLREVGRLYGQLRQYSDKLRRELDEVARQADPPRIAAPDAATARKAELRARFLKLRKALPADERASLCERVCAHALAQPDVEKARAVLVYLTLGSEVATDTLITSLRAGGKRVIVPYCKNSSHDLGVAEITDIATQTAPGEHGIREPSTELRDNFLKSDIGLVICPGVSFDRHGARLGRGKGYYDNFLRELQNRVPIVGLAFQCQVSDELFPFTYHDVPMTQVITEDGPLIPKVQHDPG